MQANLGDTGIPSFLLEEDSANIFIYCDIFIKELYFIYIFFIIINIIF